MKTYSFFGSKPFDFEVLSKKSDTIPDMSLSVREILQRYQVGSMVLPPIETGDDDTFETPVEDSFEDLADASSAINSAVALSEELQRMQNSSQKPSNSSSAEVSPSSDTSPLSEPSKSPVE